MKLFARLIRTYSFPLLLLLAAILVILRKEELQSMGNMILEMQPGWLAVALAFQVITYAAEARVYQAILRLWKKTEDLIVLMRRSIISIFIASTIPSLSLAGNIYIAKKFQDRGLSRADAVWAAIQSIATSYLSLLVFGLMSYLYLWTRGKLTVLEVVFFLLFLIIAGVIFALGSFGAKRKGRLGYYYAKVIQKLTLGLDRIIGGESPQQPLSKVLPSKELPVIVWPAVGWQMIRFVADSLTIYFIFWGFGAHVHFGIVTVGFAVASIFALISIFPGSVGQYEAAQILLYASLGVPVEMAVTVTLIYRLLALWLPLAFGPLLYKRLLIRDHHPGPLASNRWPIFSC